MELAVTALGLIPIAFALRLLIDHTCRRAPNLRPSQPLLNIISMLWCLMALAKVAFIDDIIPPGDGRTHEYIARIVADHLNKGELNHALWHIGGRNDGYRFILGMFYALTGAPEGVVYGINGALAFWGLLSVVEILCRTTRCRRIPNWLLLMLMMSPTAVFWTTANLKEGGMVWGIGMMLRLGLRTNVAGPRQSMFMPILGLCVAGFLRPHIAAAWLAGLMMGVAVRQMKLSVAFTAAAGVLAAMFALQIFVPSLFESLTQEGVVSTLESKFVDREQFGGSKIEFLFGTPTPVLDGLVMIAFRPFPHEAFNFSSLMSGVEVWCLSLITIYGWFKVRNKVRLLLHPLVMTHAAAIIALAFYFSYLYNMGLMVRQRLQVFPGMLTLAAIPILVEIYPPIKKAVLTKKRDRRLPVARDGRPTQPELQHV